MVDSPAQILRHELLSKAAYKFIQNMPLAAFIIDKSADMVLTNGALVNTFGYESSLALVDRLRRGEFLTTHFSPDAVAQFYGLLGEQGHLDSWLMRGRALDGRDLTLEVTATGRVDFPDHSNDYIEVFFVAPGNVRDAEAFLQKAKKEAELVSRAKTEFLSNISHELRTPLNIVIGMLGLASEDESINDDLRENLALAKDAADGLFTMLNDLIVLANLEARRLNNDIARFSPNMLVQTLKQHFANKVGAKSIDFRVVLDEQSGVLLDGGYNLILLALEKLVDNAVKFVDDQGLVLVQITLVEKGDGPWLHCLVSDNGPGLDENFFESQELFRQGDGSLNRKHGGLGMGLRLAANLVAALGGRLKLVNGEMGGAELSFRVPVRQAPLAGDQC